MDELAVRLCNSLTACLTYIAIAKKIFNVCTNRRWTPGRRVHSGIQCRTSDFSALYCIFVQTVNFIAAEFVYLFVSYTIGGFFFCNREIYWGGAFVV